MSSDALDCLGTLKWPAAYSELGKPPLGGTNYQSYLQTPIQNLWYLSVADIQKKSAFRFALQAAFKSRCHLSVAGINKTMPSEFAQGNENERRYWVYWYLRRIIVCTSCGANANHPWLVNTGYLRLHPFLIHASPNACLAPRLPYGCSCSARPKTLSLEAVPHCPSSALSPTYLTLILPQK